MLNLKYLKRNKNIFGYHKVSNIWHTYTILKYSLNSFIKLFRCKQFNNLNYKPLIYCPYEFQWKDNIVEYLKLTDTESNIYE